MKVGIITFHSAHNYGASLQTWAMQRFLTANGYEAEVVNYRNSKIDKAYRIDKKKSSSTMIKRHHAFEKFIAEKLNLSTPYGTLAAIQNEEHDYDAVIAGSDQIWNMSILGGLNSAYFADFGDSSMKRISYAASIGTDELPIGSEVVFQHHLKLLNFVSVREAKAQEMLKNLTDKEISVVLDPTLLLSQADFNEIRVPSDCKQPYIYLHNVHLTGEYEALNAMAEELSARLKLPIVKNRDEILFANELKPFTSGGPSEFLGMISDAAYVVTDSFHATVFSILYHKDFITVPPLKRPDRLYYLLESLHLQNHIIESRHDLHDMDALRINYDDVESALADLRLSSIDFLMNSLHQNAEKSTSLYFDSHDDFICYGCGVCQSVCPAKAIHMETDAAGFSYPVTNEALCTHCDLCRKSCIEKKHPLQNPDIAEYLKHYLAHHLDLYTRMLSQEGGVIPELLNAVFNLGGKAAGFIYDPASHRTILRTADSADDCMPFYRVHFIEPEVTDFALQIRELSSDSPLLLFATPCLIASLKSFFGELPENLYCVEQQCDGYMSPALLQAYTSYLESDVKSPLSAYSFREKKNGREKVQVVFEFDNQERITENYADSCLFQAYHQAATQRPSCYTCRFRRAKRGIGDLSVSPVPGNRQEDFTNDDNSVSLVCVYTRKGYELMDQIRDQFALKPVTEEEAEKVLPLRSLNLTSQRQSLLESLSTAPIRQLLRPFAAKPPKKK